MAGHAAVAVASAASNAAAGSSFDPTTLALWTSFTVVAGVISGAAVFTKNVLEMRKLKADTQKLLLEIAKLRQDAQDRDAAKAQQAASELQILIATHEERVQYGAPTQVSRSWATRGYGRAPLTRAIHGGITATFVAGLSAYLVLGGHDSFLGRRSDPLIASMKPAPTEATSPPVLAPAPPPTDANRSGSRDYAAQDQTLRERNVTAAPAPPRPRPRTQFAQASSDPIRKHDAKDQEDAVAMAASVPEVHASMGAVRSASSADERAVRLAAEEARAKWLEASVALDARRRAELDALVNDPAIRESKAVAAASHKPAIDAKADSTDTFRKGYEAYLTGRVADGIRMMEQADAMGAPGARARLCAIYRKPTAAEGKDFLKEANKCKGVD